MKNKIIQKELEHLFAEKFSTDAFPILADLYYNKRQYDRAVKVCKIGLQHNPDNLLGQYILSKIMIINNDFMKAEKLLQTVIRKDGNNINALLLLLELSLKLERKPKIIQKYLGKLLLKIPNNKKVKKFNKQFIKQKLSSNQKDKKIVINKAHSKSIQIADNMATKTMYQIIKKQKKFHSAKTILEIMINKKRNVSFAKNELKKINSLINKDKNKDVI